jgi:DUF4097 and DUF4098 domain-containing protein YvlB
MREEVIMILNMLEEGKITSEQAASLIEAVDDAMGLRAPEESSPAAEGDGEKPEEPEQTPSSKKPEMIEVKRLVDKLSGLADVVDRAAFENLAEKIRETVESAVKSTDQVIDRVQQEVRDRRRSVESDDEDASMARWSKTILEPFQRMFSPSIRVEKVIEGSFGGESGKKIDVALSTRNGSIVVEPWDEPGFRVNVTANVVPAAEGQANDCGAAKALVEELLKCDAADDSLKIKAVHGKALTGASFDVKLPREFLYDMDLKTQNGRVSLGEFECRMIKVETSNGRIELDNTGGVITELETSNGRIDVSAVTQRLSAKTSNGGITIIPRKITGESQYVLKTSNGAIEVKLEDADKVGYHIDAKTSLGRIVVDLPNLAYQVRDEETVRREVVAETSGFSEDTDRLTIKARTSNGQVRIMYS